MGAHEQLINKYILEKSLICLSFSQKKERNKSVYEVPKEEKKERRKITTKPRLDEVRGFEGIQGNKEKKIRKEKKKKFNSLIVRLMRRLKRGLNKKCLPIYI